MSDFSIIKRSKISGHFEVFVAPNVDIILPYWLSGVHAGNEAWAQASGPCDLRFTMEHTDVWNALMQPYDYTPSQLTAFHGQPTPAVAPANFGLAFNASQGMMWGEAQTMTAGKIISVPLTATGIRITTGAVGVRVIVAGSN